MRLKPFAIVLVALALVSSGIALRADETAGSAARDTLAPWLAGIVVQISNDAAADGALPVPAAVRAALSGYFSDDVLDSVRWKVDGTSTLLALRLFGNATVQAVTLDDLILFVSDEDAADVTLWAHELYHVMQYRDWGVEGFVARYLTDHRSIERDAKEFRWQWMTATGRVPDVTL